MADVDDGGSLAPPVAARVAHRSLVLAALVCRSAIESNSGDPDAKTFQADALRWLEAAGALQEAEPHEVRILETPLGALTEQDVIDSGWRGEGLGVLAWSLTRYDLPSYQETVPSPDVADLLGFLEPRGLEWPSRARLREADEIEALADRFLALHWRLREFSRMPAHIDFVSFAATAHFGPLDIAGLTCVDRDLAIDGLALMNVPVSRRRECLSIARERQQAANWLCGQEALYSEVTCDT